MLTKDVAPASRDCRRGLHDGLNCGLECPDAVLPLRLTFYTLLLKIIVPATSLEISLTCDRLIFWKGIDIVPRCVIQSTAHLIEPSHGVITTLFP